MSSTGTIQQAAAMIRAARRIVVFTGAGVSKESGVPTFRDAHEGLWAKYDPTELATPMAFRKNPRRVWDWYTYRRDLVGKAKPNPGHVALAQLEGRGVPIAIITQNVDDLHEQAGSRTVIHLHGNIAQDKCFADCQGEPTIIARDDLVWKGDDEPPACPHCGAPARPNVVWFHEQLPEDALTSAVRWCQSADLMLVVGTSGLVYPAAQMPVVARQAGAKLIEFNPVESALTPIMDLWVAAPSGQALPQILQAMENMT